VRIDFPIGDSPSRQARRIGLGYGDFGVIARHRALTRSRTRLRTRVGLASHAAPREKEAFPRARVSIIAASLAPIVARHRGIPKDAHAIARVSNGAFVLVFVDRFARRLLPQSVHYRANPTPICKRRRWRGVGGNPLVSRSPNAESDACYTRSSPITSSSRRAISQGKVAFPTWRPTSSRHYRAWESSLSSVVASHLPVIIAHR
jgi:hypothetical protein